MKPKPNDDVDFYDDDEYVDDDDDDDDDDYYQDDDDDSGNGGESWCWSWMEFMALNNSVDYLFEEGWLQE